MNYFGKTNNGGDEPNPTPFAEEYLLFQHQITVDEQRKQTTKKNK